MVPVPHMDRYLNEREYEVFVVGSLLREAVEIWPPMLVHGPGIPSLLRDLPGQPPNLV